MVEKTPTEVNFLEALKKLAQQEFKMRELELKEQKLRIQEKGMSRVEDGKGLMGTHGWVERFINSPHEVMETLESTAGFWKAIRSDQDGNLKVVIDGKAKKKTYGAMTINDTATKIFAPNENRKQVTIIPNTSEVVYIGYDKDLTTSNGSPYGKYDMYSDKIPHNWRGEIWGIVATGKTGDVRYTEVE